MAYLPNFRWLDDKAQELEAEPVDAPPIIRTVYIDNAEHLRLVKYCLWHTVQLNPGSRIILAIDKASVEFERWAKSLSPKVETFRPNGKRPRGGRMNLLMGQAIERINGEPMVITSEQDAVYCQALNSALWALLERYGPKAAAVQTYSCQFNSRGCYPSASHNRRFRKTREWDGFAYEMNFVTFWTVAWRPEALRMVNWTKTRKHVGADDQACQQMAVKGWRFFSTPHCRALHQPHSRITNGAKYIPREWAAPITSPKTKKQVAEYHAPRGRLIKELRNNPTDKRRAEIGRELRRIQEKIYAR